MSNIYILKGANIAEIDYWNEYQLTFTDWFDIIYIICIYVIIFTIDDKIVVLLINMVAQQIDYSLWFLYKQTKCFSSSIHSDFSINLYSI